MLQLEWLNQNNVDIIKDIAYEEFKDDMELVGDLDLYHEVLNGNKFNNIDLNYALIKDDKRVIGITGYYIPEKDPKAVWLGWLVIKPVFRHSGYGTKTLKGLINYVKKLHPELEVCRTYTGLNNEGALDFYKDFGFIQENNLYKVGKENENTVILDYPLTENGNYTEWNQVPIW